MQSLERQLLILEGLARASDRGQTVRELARQAGLPTSTTHRMLRALVAIDFASQRPEGGSYQLGAGILRLAGRFLETVGLAELTNPCLDRLTQETGLFTYAAVRDGGKVVCTSIRMPPETSNFYVRIGRLLPLHCSAAAKALIYHLEPAALRQALAPYLETRYTSRTLTSFEAVVADLERGREQGVWECREEFEWNVYAAAAPIRDGRDAPVISIAALCSLEHGERHGPEISAALKEISAETSRKLGTLLDAGQILEAR